MGLSEEDAQAALDEAGLVVGLRTQQASGEDPGTVIDQSPDAGEMVAEGSEVNLVVSGGPATVAVPDVLCQTLDSARDEIEAAGLVFEDAGDEFSTECPPGTVARQNPLPDVQVAPETTVRVWESLGPSPSPSPSPTPSPTPTA